MKLTYKNIGPYVIRSDNKIHVTKEFGLQEVSGISGIETFCENLLTFARAITDDLSTYSSGYDYDNAYPYLSVSGWRLITKEDQDLIDDLIEKDRLSKLAAKEARSKAKKDLEIKERAEYERLKAKFEK